MTVPAASDASLTSLDLRQAIVIDQSAQTLATDFIQFDAIDLRRCFTNSRTMEMLQDFVPNTISYVDMLRRLGHLLDVRGEEQIIDLRQTMRPFDLVNSLFDDVSFGAFIVDDGFSPTSSMGLKAFSDLVERPVYRSVRLENAMETALAASSTFEELSAKFLVSLRPPSSEVPIVCFKTVCANQSGLRIANVTLKDATENFDNVKQSFRTAKQNSKRFSFDATATYHYLLHQAFALAHDLKLPVQIHTGFGNSDGDLLEANPLLLRSVFETKRYSGAKFVLLHSYPYVREAAYLASLYPNVYMDLSLACNLVSPILEQILLDALSAA
ncbi:MAG: amidohydrolase family protein, partial [Leptolyngbya sp.]|nr:amidohydrolase family protein [Candidatus Melainabacteria bacterium]